MYIIIIIIIIKDMGLRETHQFFVSVQTPNSDKIFSLMIVVT